MNHFEAPFYRGFGVFNSKSEQKAEHLEHTKPILTKSVKKDGSYDWFVYYRVLNPATGKMELQKSRKGINRLKTDREKKSFGSIEVARLTKKLEKGWSPFTLDPQKDKNKEDFYWWFQKRIDYSKAMHGYYNWRKLNSIFQQMKEFKPELKVRDVNFSFLKEYEVWLKTEKNNTANTIADKMMRLSIVMGEIEHDGEVERKNNPFYKATFATDRVIKERLTEDQVNMLINVKLSGKVAMARDMYLLSFYCAGIRFGDLARLKPEMFESGRLIYEMGKTQNKKKERNLLLTKKAIAIYNIYKNNKPYLFPIGVNWDQEKKSINAVNVGMNKYLKKACKLAKIPELTFHTSRNTFADIAVKKKTGTRQLKELFAHTKESTTEIYMKDFYKEETDEALKNIFE